MLEKAVFNNRQGTADGFSGWTDAGRRTAMRLDPSDRTAGPIPFATHLDLDTLVGAQDKGPAGASLAEPAQKAGGTDDAYTFADVIDIINPLQHLPVIGTVYRQLTGDTIKGMSAILGGALFGGPIGAVVSTADVIVRDRTGMDATQNLMALAGLPTGERAVQKPDIRYTAPEALGNNDAFSMISTPHNGAAKAYAVTAGGQRNFAFDAAAEAARWNA